MAYACTITVNYVVCTQYRNADSQINYNASEGFCFEVPRQTVNSKLIIPPQRLKTRNIYFQQQWYDKYPWLHYDVNTKAVLCFNCAKTTSLDLLRSVKCSDPCFISTGFNKWKKATGDSGRFANHQETTCNKAAMSAMQNLQKPETVATLLSLQLSEEQHAAQKCIIYQCRLSSSSRYSSTRAQ